MEKNYLGSSEIGISSLGIGTMTFGEQNTQAQAFGQLDCAIHHGVNLIDTAEMYPVPPREKTFTRTEQIIGNWIQSRKCRQNIVLATKVVGPTVQSRTMGSYIRDGINHLTKKNIGLALEGSLRRLKTETIDIYQIHWPDRTVNIFGKQGFIPPTNTETDNAKILETLRALENLKKEGKIRAYGVSNETPWGVMQYLNYAEKKCCGKIVSIQNPYSLLNRSFEAGLAEISYRESLGLLAYSPLAFGLLTGKYLDGKKPVLARLTLFSRFQRYQNKNALKATKEYIRLAKEHSMDPSQMALAFARTRPFMSSVLIGATSINQLETNLASVDVKLSEELLKGIEDIHNRIPNPCP